jgi:hypothetical protein
MYTRKDWEKLEEEEEENKDNNIKKDLPEPPFTVGTKAVLPEEIVGYETSFSYGKTLEEVNIAGPDLTHVVLKNGIGLACLWSIEDFESNLNKFIKKQKQDELDSLIEETKEKAIQIRQILEEELSSIKEQYEKEGIPLPINLE